MYINNQITKSLSFSSTSLPFMRLGLVVIAHHENHTNGHEVSAQRADRITELCIQRSIIVKNIISFRISNDDDAISMHTDIENYLLINPDVKTLVIVQNIQSFLFQFLTILHPEIRMHQVFK